jgi:hypothetical protein
MTLPAARAATLKREIMPAVPSGRSILWRIRQRASRIRGSSGESTTLTRLFIPPRKARIRDFDCINMDIRGTAALLRV